MFERLLRVLWRPHNFYCVHVDSKTPPEVYRLVRAVADCFPNVVVAEERVDLVYLSIGSLLSDLQCMRLALDSSSSSSSSVAWRYYLNLSGQEFPLKTNLEMVQILTSLNGKNDAESYLPTSFVKTWFAYKHVIVNGSVYQTTVRKEPFLPPIPVRKGSAYGAFSRPFLVFALTSPLARRLTAWLTDTMAPDELFWATLNHLPGVPGGVPRPVSHRYGTVLSRAVVWEWDAYKCGRYVRGVCIFTASDLPWLASRPELVANKFDEEVDPVALDCLEVALERRALLAFRQAASSPLDAPAPLVDSLNWTFYRSLPHVAGG